MRLTKVTAPAVVAVDRAVVFQHLRSIADMNSDPDDADYIDELIGAAVDRLDGPNGLLNRALVTQTWRATFERWPAEILVPLARCRSVDSIEYMDPEGGSPSYLVLEPSAYRVAGLHTDDCRITPARGTSWPSTLCDPEAIAVTFISGFGDAVDDVPGSIRMALLEMVATSYAYRESVTSGSTFLTLPASATRAVADWVVWPK